MGRGNAWYLVVVVTVYFIVDTGFIGRDHPVDTMHILVDFVIVAPPATQCDYSPRWLEWVQTDMSLCFLSEKVNYDSSCAGGISTHLTLGQCI
jgi:hypothetical protein